jgi:hypothetical protein
MLCVHLVYRRRFKPHLVSLWFHTYIPWGREHLYRPNRVAVGILVVVSWGNEEWLTAVRLFVELILEDADMGG